MEHFTRVLRRRDGRLGDVLGLGGQEALDGELGAAVGVGEGLADGSADAGHREDPATSGLPHRRQDEPGEVNRGDVVDLELRPDRVDAELLGGADHALAGVVDQHRHRSVVG